MAMPSVKEILHDEIAQAFAHRVHPGDDRIAVTRPWLTGYEGNQVAEYFKGKQWQDLTYGRMRTDYPSDPTAAIHFMRDEGFAYYLPAFLGMAMDMEVAGDMADTIVSALTEPAPSAATVDRSRFAARMATLSLQEKKTIRDVLMYLAKEYDRIGYPDNPARKAIGGYWSQLP